MNGLDYMAVALFAIGAIYGLQRGALRMVTSVVSLAAAVYFASLYYSKAGAFAETQMGSSHTVGAVIGYVAVFALIFTAVEMIGSAAIRLLQIAHMSTLDRLGDRRCIRGTRGDADGGGDAARRAATAQLAVGADAARVQRNAGRLYSR